MPNYTDVFGGAIIYPSEISYSSVSLKSGVEVDKAVKYKKYTREN